MDDLKETFDKSLNPLDVEVGFESPVQQVEVHDVLGRFDKTRVQKRFVKGTVETIGREMLGGRNLLNKAHGLNAGVEVGRVGDLENGVDLFSEPTYR